VDQLLGGLSDAGILQQWALQSAHIHHIHGRILRNTPLGRRKREVEDSLPKIVSIPPETPQKDSPTGQLLSSESEGGVCPGIPGPGILTNLQITK